MVLSDRDLLASLADGRIVVDPLGYGAVQPASIDVRLGDQVLLSVDGFQLDPGAEWLTYDLDMDSGDSMTLRSGEFALGTTLETVTVPDDLLCIVHGRSSVGRSGLQVECAGLVDPGWSGEITLELVNLGARPVELRPGMPIAQLTFTRLTSPAERPYGSPGVGRYQGQRGPTPAREVSRGEA